MTKNTESNPSKELSGGQATKPKVAIVYHYFQHYRAAVFSALTESEVYDYEFFADTENMYASGVEPWRYPAGTTFSRARCRKLPLGFMWQSDIVQLAFRRDLDTLIFFGNVYYLATWVTAVLARMMGKRVLFWGHIWHGVEGGWKDWLRERFYRLAHGLLLYGHDARDVSIKKGFDPDSLHVIYNSLDYAEQQSMRESISADELQAFRAELFEDASLPVVGCVTRLIERRRLDWLIEAAKSLKDEGHNLNLLFVGEGPEETRLKTMVKEYGLQAHFFGATYDAHTLAKLSMLSCVTAAPGMVGLSAMQSLAFGVPVVTHDALRDQMPEYEAVVPGRTGDLFPQGDIVALAATIKKWTSVPAVDSEVQASCIAMVEDFYHPEIQRKLIERAVAGDPPVDDFEWRVAIAPKVNVAETN